MRNEFNPKDVLRFWFIETSNEQWFQKSNDFDELIKSRFAELLLKASKCELYKWRNSSQGRLAEIIILDQFSRNIFRNDLRSFSNDSLALSLAIELVNCNLDKQLSDQEVSFAYMPFMHSESKLIHQEAVRLYSSRPGLVKNLEFEILHKNIIDRFGRYPHRNAILGRESTLEELDFLKEKNSSF